MTVALELTELRVTDPERFARLVERTDPFQRRGMPCSLAVEIDVMGPAGMSAVLREKDPFQWAVRTPREVAEDEARRQRHVETGWSA